jgi:hypothetical protein
MLGFLFLKKSSSWIVIVLIIWCKIEALKLDYSFVGFLVKEKNLQIRN